MERNGSLALEVRRTHLTECPCEAQRLQGVDKGRLKMPFVGWDQEAPWGADVGKREAGWVVVGSGS